MLNDVFTPADVLTSTINMVGETAMLRLLPIMSDKNPRDQEQDDSVRKDISRLRRE